MEGTTTEQDQQIAPPEALAALGGIRSRLAAIKDEINKLEIPDTAGTKPKTKLALFAELDAIAKLADPIAKRAKDRRESLWEVVLGTLDELGIQRFPIQGGPTIYRAREIWAGLDVDEDLDPGEKEKVWEEACAALREAGLDQYAVERFNTQSLSGYFREREKELEAEIREREGLAPDDPVILDLEDLIPEALKGKVRLTEKIFPKAKAS